ncbi:hypothetical protein GGX14DRAFT_382464 [Mycena pura]|uniref:Nephrocystin 3-like N-terminal domain-containing protein n=1 Tax=Mycena pura TaxID=153505 RepID=A0AAD6UM11_9AGAR|nr:hypothetical protein GGX14DRAFT_382464 [Mycena pura]
MDGLIVSQAVELQFQSSIVEPFKAADLQMAPVLIVDGLDECEHYRKQQKILRLIIRAICSRELPMRTLIVSRPEPHIREVFGIPENSQICHHLELSADRTAYEDIRHYLRDEFNKIHSDCLKQGIDLRPMWPSPDVLDDLVIKSSGTFIYASTVARFISDQYTHPQTQLISVLNLEPKGTSPLDDLYTQILSVIPQEDQSLRILHHKSISIFFCRS